MEIILLQVGYVFKQAIKSFTIFPYTLFAALGIKTRTTRNSLTSDRHPYQLLMALRSVVER
jgi:hypothetical protein